MVRLKLQLLYPLYPLNGRVDKRISCYPMFLFIHSFIHPVHSLATMLSKVSQLPQEKICIRGEVFKLI